MTASVKNAGPRLPRQVLVVEDDLDSSEVLASVLAFEGYEPIVARNGREALAQLAAGLRPDVILLDLMMPVMDGVDFRRRQRLRADIATIPVIICSAVEGPAPADLDARAILKTPLDFDALVALLRSV